MKKYRSKFDCLIFKMLFIRDLNPELNTQEDSILCDCMRILFYIIVTFFFTFMWVSWEFSNTFIVLPNFIFIFDLIVTLSERPNVFTLFRTF